jgi:1-acyl-sn-glycerol-3-phosphate acyltransferase
MHLTYWLGHRFFREVARGLFDFRVVNEHHLAQPGGAILAANHVSFLDPPFIGQAFDEPIYFFARRTLFDHPLAGWLLRQWQSIPIDRDRPDAGSLKATIRTLRQGGKVLMFPEGTRSLDGRLQPAKAGVGLFIAKTQVPVIPLYIHGTLQALPRGARMLRPVQITLVVGEPYLPELGAGSQDRDLYQQLADEVMGRITALRASLQLEEDL